MSILIRNTSLKTYLVDYFESKKMLIDVIITACSIPLLTSDLYGKKIFNNYFCDNFYCNNFYQYFIVNPNYDIDIPLNTYFFPNDVNKIKLIYNYGQKYYYKANNNLIKNTKYISCIIFLNNF